MSTNIKDLKELMLQVARKQPPVNFTLSQAEDALRKELKELAKDYNSYRRNKLTIFELIQDTVDDVLPNRVIESMGRFAEIKQFGQGQKPVFTRKLGKQRGKSFVTQVGLSGIYETFRLDSASLDVPTKAYGGATVIEFERFLDGLENLDELMDIVQIGLEDAFYTEVQDALKATYNSPFMPAANIHTAAGFDGDEFAKLANVVKAYGGNANAFCTPEFAGKVTTSGSFVGATGYSQTEQQELRDKGYIGKFKGTNIFVLPQSFVDESNTELVIDPAYAYIIPSGGKVDEKIVKIALEGGTIVDDYKNADRSMEIQVYKKFGIAVLNTNYYAIYRDSELMEEGS
jgi:hypothetical protein